MLGFVGFGEEELEELYDSQRREMHQHVLDFAAAEAAFKEAERQKDEKGGFMRTFDNSVRFAMCAIAQQDPSTVGLPAGSEEYEKGILDGLANLPPAPPPSA